MSTIVRSSSDSRSGRGGRGGRGDRAEGVGTVRRGGRESQRPLTARGLRVRNACVCHAAARLGLAAPTDADLRALPDHARLDEAVEWWRARAPGAAEVVESGRGVSLMLKTAVIMGVTLVGLAMSYGQAQ